jgi:hypothetical protein
LKDARYEKSPKNLDELKLNGMPNAVEDIPPQVLLNFSEN